jgi:hypothetical protein
VSMTSLNLKYQDRKARRHLTPENGLVLPGTVHVDGLSTCRRSAAESDRPRIACENSPSHKRSVKDPLLTPGADSAWEVDYRPLAKRLGTGII